MDFKHVLREFLKTSTKKSDQEIDSLINESSEAETLTALIEFDRARVAKLVEPIAGKQEQFEKAGYKKAMDKLEKSLKAKYEIDSDLQGDELVEAIIAAKTESSKNAKNLTDDDVKKHPVYQGLEKAKRDELKAKQTEMEQQIADLQKGYSKKETFSKVSKEALNILEQLKPILPTNPAAAQTQKDRFLKEFSDFEFDIQGDNILAMKDGKVVDDGHGNTTDFATIVKSKASSWFDFSQNNGGSNGGNGNAGSENGNQGGNTGKKTFKKYEDLVTYSQDTSVPIEQRQQALADWEAQPK